MEKYLLRIGSKTFEPIRPNANTFECVYDGSRFINVEDTFGTNYHLISYLEENGEIIGVKLLVDYGHGYGFNNGTEIIELKPGTPFSFSHEGTSIDDEGCPEEYYIDYVLELYDWDERLLNIQIINR